MTDELIEYALRFLARDDLFSRRCRLDELAQLRVDEREVFSLA